MYCVSFLIAALVSSATARSLVLEHVPVLPEGWAKTDKTVDASRDIGFKIALRQPAADKIAAAPSGQHLSAEQVQTLQTPDAQEAAQVIAWLAASGISDVKQKNDIISVRTTVEKAEKLLETKFAKYDFEDKHTFVRAEKYAVPEKVHSYIDFIYPITHFMAPTHGPIQAGNAIVSREQAASHADAFCKNGVTPACIKKLYNVTYKAPNAKGSSTPTSEARLAINGYLEEKGSHKDAKQFFAKYAPDLSKAQYDFAVELVNNGTNSELGTGEAMLDIEYAMGLGYPANTTFYSTGGTGDKLGDDGKPEATSDNEPYLDFIQHLLEKPDNEIPHVLSVSYGDDELTVPQVYAKRVCDAYGLLTKRGTTVIHSSGDGGAAGGHGSNCRSKDGKNTEIAMATFPAGCPWVTAIGGVEHTTEPPSGVSFSSGGFSTYFERPSWQDTVVPAYQKQIGNLMSGKYPKNGRGIPDISAVATNFQVVVSGQEGGISGTSASAPLIAGLISLVNDARLRKGKQSIGFLNPHLYSDNVQKVLQDITKGTSNSCSFSSGTPGGWPAKKGWDAITGLGVPKDFQKFLDALVAV